MAVPVGTIYYVPITVNHSYVSSTITYFVYEADLSSKLASDSIFKGQISSASNIAIYDPTLDLKLNRWCFLDLINNKLQILFNSSTSTSIDKTYWVCVGPAINESNSSDCVTLSGYNRFYPFNEFTNGASSVDCAGGSNASVTSLATIGNTGKFGNCARNTGSSGNLAMSYQIPGAYEIAFEFLIFVSSLGSSGRGRFFENWPFMCWSNSTNNLMFSSDGGSTNAYLSMSFGVWHHIVINKYSSGVVDLYRDGSLISSAGSGGIGSLGEATFWFTNNSGGGRTGDLYLDEFGLHPTILSSGYILTRYNMFFNASVFWTIGTGQYIVIPSPYQFMIDYGRIHIYATTVKLTEIDELSGKINLEFPNGIILQQK